MLFRNLLISSVLLTFIVIVLGAYVRLSDAGLSCPDWPGCYAELIVPDDNEAVAKAYPGRPLERGKAWKEMGHRYVAGTLLILVLALAVAVWSNRSINTSLRALLTVISALLVFQALLGMWTVTLLLKPVIVMLHLLSGMTILSLLYWAALRVTYGDRTGASSGLRVWGVLGLIVLAMQIALGGWTSANYAALVCPDLPTCQGRWWPNMDFAEGFRLWRKLGVDYQGGILQADARTAIHVAHRIGAVITFCILFALGMRAFIEPRRAVKITAIVLLLLLCLQIGIGIANIILALPLPAAVAHNAVAALLLLSAITLLHHARAAIP